MNNIWLDKQYVNKISGRLRNFNYKSNSPYKVNFSCPYCGDSKLNTLKARAWISEYKNHLNFKCFNCDYSTSFNNFLKWFDVSLYKEFRFEHIKENNSDKEIDLSLFKSKVSFDNPLRKIKNLTDLDENHIAVKYFHSRKIPIKHLKLFFYAPKFISWINSIEGQKMGNRMKEEPRLIIPFYDLNNKVFAISARSFEEKSSLRYITIKFTEANKIYGLERIDLSKMVTIVEGNIDSLFLDNALAFAGGSGNIENFRKDLIRVVYDNEPRNEIVCNKYLKTISEGYKIIIWPEWLKDRGKDINDYILSGISEKEIQDIINKNTFAGLKALTKFKEWQKFS